MSITAPTTTLSGTFDKWAFEFACSGDGCLAYGAAGPVPPVIVTARMTKYRIRDSDSLAEKSPLPSDQVLVIIPDLYASAAEDEDVQAALTAIIALVEKYGTIQGFIPS